MSIHWDERYREFAPSDESETIAIENVVAALVRNASTCRTLAHRYRLYGMPATAASYDAHAGQFGAIAFMEMPEHLQ